ncbi:O-antigen polymerase [Halomonas salifodinae]
MIKHFICSWLFYWLLVFLIPASSVYDLWMPAFFLQLCFIFLVLIGYSWFWFASNARPPEWGARILENSEKMIYVSLILSVIGTASLIYDKIIIQNIDYSQGIAVAREMWRKEGGQREGGVSSIFSALGYLLSSSYYVSAVLLIVNGKRLMASFIYKVSFLIFFLLMVNSVLAGGRSNLLLIMVFVFGAVSAVPGWSYKTMFASKALRGSIFVLLVISSFYLLYVFSERAEATGIDATSYVKNFLPYLGLKLNPWFSDKLNSGLLSSLFSLIALAISYITHSFSTVSAILDHGPGDKVIIFLHPVNIVYKLGLISRPDGLWFLSGRFPSLPGALYYQFGVLGFVVFSLLIGFLGGVSKVFYIFKPCSLVALGFYLMMYGVLVVSPLLLVVDFMSFPFVMFSFFMIGAMFRIKCCVKRLENKAR